MVMEIIIAAISFIGTCTGTVGGIIASARLTNYRLAQLEEKVGNHNNFAERMPVVEEQIREMKFEIREIKKDIC